MNQPTQAKPRDFCIFPDEDSLDIFENPDKKTFDYWERNGMKPTHVIEYASYLALKKQAEGLVERGKSLLERIDHNGGIGEYKGGPSFVVEPFREALAAYEKEGG